LNKKSAMPHWYKEKRSNFQNNVIYNFLRLCKYPPSQAKRMMYWSIPHIKLKIASDEK